MLKPSKFNYTVLNNYGELLMFNTYTGCMLKSSQDSSKLADSILHEKKIEASNQMITDMGEAGLLVDYEECEAMKVQDVYVKMQSRPILELTILPTEQCNFRCVYCPEAFNRGEMSEEVQNAIIQYVRRNLHTYTGVSVSWFGGEPLLAMGVIANLSTKLMKLCKDANRSYFAGITTNAYLLTHDVFRELLDYNVLNYQITVDGLKESHDIQRPLNNGAPTYETVIKNLLDIKETTKSGKFSVILRTNFTKGMIPDITRYFDWYRDTFASDQRFKLFVKMAGNYGGERVCDVEEELISGSESKELFFHTIEDSEMGHHLLYNKVFYQCGSAVCEAGKRNAMVIDSSGAVRKCACYLLDDDNNRLCSIMEMNTKKINSSFPIQWHTIPLKDKCDACFYSPACLGMSCMYINLLTGFPQCPEYKTDIDRYLKLFDKQGMFKTIQ